ncbi:MAG TPA: efflux RND transporter periplasmic adaptor subunit, partial [bacterium]|nr:efflux RND transporter periplasmic adaptor subunit [bacterium]
KIDPAVVQNLGVRTTEAKLGKLVKKIRAVGTFETNEESLVSVNTKVEGWIEKLYVNKAGQTVKRGDPLLKLYSPELVSTQQEYIESLRYLDSVKDSPFPEVVESARSLVLASEKRLRLWDISSAQIKRLARTGKAGKDLTLYAPISGVVMKREAVKGMKVMPGMELLSIADLSTLWLQSRFYEQDVAWVRLGDHARIEVDYLPGDTFSGKVSFIYPYLDSKTRDITARIVIDNHDLKLKPGMFATITIEHESEQPVVSIPDEAVIRTGVRNLVFIDLGGGRFVPREVGLGRYGDGRTIEIKSGLIPGERVAVSGQFLIDSESRMEEAVRKMLEAQKTEAQQPAMPAASPEAAPPQKMNMEGMDMKAEGGK